MYKLWVMFLHGGYTLYLVWILVCIVRYQIPHVRSRGLCMYAPFLRARI